MFCVLCCDKILHQPIKESFASTLSQHKHNCLRHTTTSHNILVGGQQVPTISRCPARHTQRGPPRTRGPFSNIPSPSPVYKPSSAQATSGLFGAWLHLKGGTHHPPAQHSHGDASLPQRRATCIIPAAKKRQQTPRTFRAVYRLRQEAKSADAEALSFGQRAQGASASSRLFRSHQSRRRGPRNQGPRQRRCCVSKTIPGKKSSCG